MVTTRRRINRKRKRKVAKADRIPMPEQLTIQMCANISQRIEDGTGAPWHKAWTGRPTQHMNVATNHILRGMNPIMLDMLGGFKYEECRWLTYNQAKQLGGYVRSGEKSILLSKPIVIKKKEIKEGETEPEDFIWFVPYKVFNVEQCENLDIPPMPTVDNSEFNPIEEAEQIIRNMPDAPQVTHNGGDRAFYRIKQDTIHLPEQGAFDSTEEYYSTLFHEIGHSTGHESRVGREGIKGFNHFGSGKYAREELVAEFVSAILCRQSGITNTIENSEAYLLSWMKALQNDNKLLMQATTQAHKAVKYILGGE